MVAQRLYASYFLFGGCLLIVTDPLSGTPRVNREVLLPSDEPPGCVLCILHLSATARDPTLRRSQPRRPPPNAQNHLYMHVYIYCTMK